MPQHSQRGISSIFIIIVILVVGILVVSFWIKKNKENIPGNTDQITFQPSPTPVMPKNPEFVRLDTQSWNRYTNFSKRYSLYYPPNWFISENPDVGKYHLPGNALILNKKITDLKNEDISSDLVLGEISILTKYTDTDPSVSEENFYNTQSVQYWKFGEFSSGYLFPPMELNLGRYRIMQQKSYPIEYITQEMYNFNVPTKSWMRSDYYIWLGSKKPGEFELLHVTFYQDEDNSLKDQNINLIFNLLSTLEIKN